MPRNAHQKSEYRLRKLPFCSRCNYEFILVLSDYEEKSSLVWEWECPKCHKCVPRELLKEEQELEEDKILKKFTVPSNKKKKKSGCGTGKRFHYHG